MTKKTIEVGFELGTGKPIEIPLLNLAVTGQTQESGKTTTLEALASRSGANVLTFVTKRGESSFTKASRIQPYFRDRADWVFVDAIIEAAMQEKNKFLRQFLIPICRNTETLGDVQKAIRDGMNNKKTNAMKQGAFVQLDAYLDLIVPEIRRAKLAKSLDLKPGLNVMDLSDFTTPMQMLFVQSAIDWVNQHERDTIIVIPEAWEFIPEGKGSPVKASAVSLVRKGSGIGNRIWVDSQDMAGVDKTILRGCPVWLIGVQREINEIKRNIANIPPPTGKPKPGDVAMLERGQFFACFGKTLAKIYVWPSWMKREDAIAIAKGMKEIDAVPQPMKKEITVTKDEADALRARNAELETQVGELTRKLTALENRKSDPSPAPSHAPRPSEPIDQTLVGADAIYADIRQRLLADPVVLKVLAEQPEIEVTIEKRTIEMDGSNLSGRIATLIAKGWFDDGRTNAEVVKEICRTGSSTNSGNVSGVLSKLLKDGFVTLESGNKYTAVNDMKVSIKKAA